MEQVAKLFRRAGYALLLTVIVLVGFAAFSYFFVFPKIGVNKRVEEGIPPVSPTQELVKTNLQSFEASIGPLLTTDESSNLRSQSGVRNLALILSTGRVVYSPKSFAFSQDGIWTKSTPFEIKQLSLVNKTGVEFVDQGGNRYDLNITQPFVFEGKLDTVYAVDNEGQVWSTPLKGLTLVDASSQTDPAIAPNPLLNISFGN